MNGDGVYANDVYVFFYGILMKVGLHWRLQCQIHCGDDVCGGVAYDRSLMNGAPNPTLLGAWNAD